MKQGAYDYLATKPFDIDEVAVVAERALEARRLRIDNRRLSAPSRRSAAASSGAEQAGCAACSRPRAAIAASRDSLAPCAKGRDRHRGEFVAELLHAQSTRAKKPPVRFNCGALPAEACRR